MVLGDEVTQKHCLHDLLAQGALARLLDPVVMVEVSGVVLVGEEVSKEDFETTVDSDPAEVLDTKEAGADSVGRRHQMLHRDQEVAEVEDLEVVTAKGAVAQVAIVSPSAQGTAMEIGTGETVIVMTAVTVTGTAIVTATVTASASATATEVGRTKGERDIMKMIHTTIPVLSGDTKSTPLIPGTYVNLARYDGLLVGISG